MQQISSSQRTSHRQLWVSEPGGRSNIFSDAKGRFSIVGKGDFDARHVLQLDPYSAAEAFVNAEFDIRGDIIEAVRCFSQQPHGGLRSVMYSLLARLEHLRIHSLLSGREDASKNVPYQDDGSNEFYSLFLDSRLVYSAAYFDSPEESLELAQEHKLDLICRDLVLSPRETFLDIGCGWGGLILHAAERFGVKANGCTIASQQLDFVRREIAKHRLTERVSVSLCDYRDVTGSYQKIASVGMFEHVGKNRLGGYFRKMYSLLEPGGLFLNRGIVRPQNVNDGPESLFMLCSAFPGGELVHLDDVLREGERAGFEAVGMRDLRTHYALTCRAWARNLEHNKDRCTTLAGDRAYRTWLLYIAAASVAFEEGRTGAAQVLFSKPRR
jgi:cyclopropane-fatty-acyl-phospholipid synthase